MKSGESQYALSLSTIWPKSLGVAVVSSFSYESFFGLLERPFSLTPDSKYYFRSRSHARAFDTLTVELSDREGFALVTGDVGVGKTTLGRALVQHIGRAMPVSVIANPLISPEDLLRVLLADFAAIPREHAIFDARLLDSRDELHERLQRHLQRSDAVRRGAALVIDEAQHLPEPVIAELQALSSIRRDGAPALSTILIGQLGADTAENLAIRQLDRDVTRRVRLLPLERDECAGYVEHRLGVAGASTEVTFSARAIETLYNLSGGVPRLLNLLCERALQEGALAGARCIEPPMVEISAAELDLRRPRPRRFRWFSRKTG